MDDIRNKIVEDLEAQLNTNSHNTDFVLGKTIMTKESKLQVETFNGQTLTITDFIPGMPIVFEGTLIPVEGVLIVNYGIALEFFVAEALADATIQAITETVHTRLTRQSYLLDVATDTYVDYLASEPQVTGSEIFNYRKFIKVRLPIAATVNQGVKRGTDIKISIKEKGSADPVEYLPFLTAAISVEGQLYTAQRNGEESAVSIITDRGWAGAFSLYNVDGIQTAALYNMIRQNSLMNTVFELTIERATADIETMDVIVAKIEEVLDVRQLSSYVVTFAYAAEVL